MRLFRLFRNLRVGRKLALLVALSLTILAILTTVSYSNVGTITRVNERRASITAVNRQLALLDMKQSDVQIAQRNGLLATTDEARQAAQTTLDQASQIIDEAWNNLTTTELSPQLIDAVNALRTTYDTYLDEVDATFPTLLATDPGTPEAATVLQTEIDRARQVQDTINATRQTADQEQTTADTELDAALLAIKQALALGAAIALIITTAVATAITRSITRPLQTIETALQHIADGDLRVRCDIQSADEVGRMANALNQTMETTDRAIGGIHEIARQLSSSSEELAAASGQVSGNVGTIAVATRELLSSIDHIATNTEQAAQVARSAVELGSSASDLVGDLGHSAQAIGTIIDLIGGIARQTNLLALNATIEAARAGTHGRGFAVVASEVKDLANASSSATDAVQAKIESIQHDAQRASVTIEDIARVVETIHQGQQIIAAAVEQQTHATVEMSTQLDQIAAVSNAIASGDDTGIRTASAGDLAEMAGRLHLLVQHFRTS